MSIRKALLAATIVVGVVAVQTVPAQQKPNVSTLTAGDYVEIQQLVARYAYAVDTHADNGYAYADLFAPDGVFGGKTKGREKGREALADLARNTQKERGGSSYTR